MAAWRAIDARLRSGSRRRLAARPAEPHDVKTEEIKDEIFCATHHFHHRHRSEFRVSGDASGGSGRQGKDLPNGTAMPLGKFQEDLHLRQGVPLIASMSRIYRRVHRENEKTEGQSRDKSCNCSLPPLYWQACLPRRRAPDIAVQWHVRSSAQTGSDRHAAKVTRLTLNGVRQEAGKE